ncbi:MAG: rhodanese-like domain-containing protein [Deltaproteobacteria bacterium]|nr:rhodanese-like domain-containing protein [Deltaproteobacteria bacterium]
MNWPVSKDPPAAATASERLLRANFRSQCWRNSAGAPMVAAEFVAEAGRRVHIVDVRSLGELTSAIGYIPRSYWVPPERIAELATRLPSTAFVVLVSRSGDRASLLARYLELLGMHFVAALDGGIRDWLLKGMVTRRSEEIITRTVDTIPNEDPFAGTAQSLGEAGGALSLDDVREHIGDPGSVRWVKLASMVVNGRQSCVDGRDDKGVLGTPGGNAGEFLLSLAAIERSTGEQVQASAVSDLLESYVQAVGRFYMHSDTDTMTRLILKLRSVPELEGLLPPLPGRPEEWRRWMANPPMVARDVLRSLLVDADYVGCGHLKRMLVHHEEYKVRPELTRAFISALYELHWAGLTTLTIEILGGDHFEGAVVSVVVDEDPLHAFSTVPLVSPSGSHGQMFLNTPQVSQYLRSEAITFFMRKHKLSPLRREHEGRYLAALGELANVQAGSTLGALADGLPRFEVRFHDEDDYEVTAAQG